ncbi:ATP-binding protein [Paenibacillus sp. SC116]|uniref:ATP-binding protein n=1 Tax=Paenibacillus sp. SC116 TaxID=2968986 RepID=UPI00215B241B|nr:ATP-binding protein [Paenibacillus sp. SC116]MCR8844290.1 ATP-binding protein [Paenibacillus sp. SC116]
MTSVWNKLRRIPVAIICLWTVLLFVLFAVPLFDIRTEQCAVSEKGIMDFSSCSMENEGPISIDGLWEYIPSQLLLSEPIDSGNAAFVRLPHQWNPNGWKPFLDDDVYYATYRIKLKLPPNYRNYAIRVTNVKTASKLYADGELIGSTGQVGSSSDSSTPYNRPYNGYFSADRQEVELVLQASNFDFYANQGVSEPIYIGTPDGIHTMEKRKGYVDISTIVCLLFMAIYLFGESLHRREGKSGMFFPLFCFFSALYVASHGEKVLLEFMPYLSFEVNVKIQLISGAAAGYFITAHICHQFQPYASVKVPRVIGGLTLLITLMALFTPMSFFSRFTYLLLLVLTTVVVYMMVVSVKAVHHKLAGSMYMFISMLAVLQVILLMALKVVWVGTITLMLPIGIPIFVLSQGLFFSSRFTSAFNRSKQLSEQLATQMKDQEQFLVRTSHELKSPLNAIINISQSMIHGSGGQLNAAQQFDLRLVNGTAQRLSYLVKDILDHEQVKNGRIRLHTEPVDLYRVVSVVLDIFNRLNHNDEVELRNNVEPGKHYVIADENRILQSLYNLLDNALKHTPSGSITVSCVHQGSWESITVTDTGVGMESSQLERIFMEYQQLERKGFIDTTGIGIGLSITKQLIELQGGHISVRSAPGEGSAFTFVLPSANSSQQAVDSSVRSTDNPYEAFFIANPVQEQSSVIELSLAGELIAASTADAWNRKARILLVDDNYASLKALSNLLEIEGYICESARSGEAALELLKDGNRFNLCIMDVMMPKMSGFELCRTIRLQYHSLELPILMATAGSNVQLNLAGFEAGANDFIHKPFDWTDLKGRVKTLIQLKETAVQLVHSERDMLRAQIKPHFLFNSINTISWMSKRDSDETRRLLHALSDFLRGSFDFDNQADKVSFTEELALIKAYVSLEQARFGERLHVEYALEVKDFLVPPLLLQPIVENAVRHGLMEKVEGGTVIISSRKVGEWIELSVLDDGVGIGLDEIELDVTAASPQLDGKRKGIGLANINSRLRNMYGTSLDIRRHENGGTVVTMKIRAEKGSI